MYVIHTSAGYMCMAILDDEKEKFYDASPSIHATHPLSGWRWLAGESMKDIIGL